MQNSKILRYTNMIIVNTNVLQVFNIIPNKPFGAIVNNNRVKITNETTKQTFDTSIQVISYVNDICQIEIREIYNFWKEDNFYTLEVYLITTSDMLYKDRLFCTTQLQSTYSINNGQYVTPTIDNNSYITI